MATVSLTPEAVKRLGIVTAPSERKKVERTRSFGGDLMVPLGRANTEAASGGPDPSARSIYALLPSLTSTELVRLAETQVDADGQVEAAKVQWEAAKVVLARAEELLSNKAGSVRAVDEAKAQAALAEAHLKTMHARRELLGAPLFDAVKQNLLWVRVPVYVGALTELHTGQPARVGGLADKPGATTRPAKPISVPLSTATAATTVDLYYELENPDGALRPGQKVMVNIPLQGEEESLTVPWAAVLHDIHGGTWVYEETAPQTYARRRVQVRHVSGDLAVLASGPGAGAKIVSAGAAELFGTEVGFGK